MKKKRKLNDEIVNNNEKDSGENEESITVVDVHDDLKREVAFYDTALESVTLARAQCATANIPFARPTDFFAEMVKSDDHMAKIKDRLIYETKKMDAVERRKSNKEQTVMAKERHAHRLSEKAKVKKAHMSNLDDWKKSAERGRSGLGGRVHDRDDDDDRLRGMGGGGGNKYKRENSNKKYGFGGKGKVGRFKQNDKATLNDMSGFKPRGGFGGMGQKSQTGGKKNKSGGGGGGNKRQGKRARDASRSR
jgi:rRNA-processing protein EBP2